MMKFLILVACIVFMQSLQVLAGVDEAVPACGTDGQPPCSTEKSPTETAKATTTKAAATESAATKPAADSKSPTTTAAATESTTSGGVSSFPRSMAIAIFTLLPCILFM